MSKLGVRIALVVVAVAAACAGGYVWYTAARRGAEIRAEAREFGEATLRLQGILANLRAAQAAYVAAGQSPAAWMGTVTDLGQQADAGLEQLASTPTGPDVDREVAAAIEALASFTRFDTRARERLLEAQPLTASSLIFTEAARALGDASRSLGSARGTRHVLAEEAAAAQARLQWYSLGGAALVLLAVLGLLTPAPAARRKPDDASLAPSAGPQPASAVARGGLDLDLRAVAAPRAPANPALPPATEPQPVMKPDLPATARLCTELACVKDTSELQALLGRAAEILDAAGIVIWLGGPEGEVLRPVFSYGYGAQALGRMQALPRDGGTPVSAAFRTGRLEIVPAENRTSGAIVAPILTTSGCVGAMAVETRHGAESREGAQALATIIAAQVATLMPGEGEP